MVTKDGAVERNTGKAVDTSIVYDDKFLVELARYAETYPKQTDYNNELHLYFLIPLLEKVEYMKRESIEKIEFQAKNTEEAFFWRIAAAYGQIVTDEPINLIEKMTALIKAKFAFVAVIIYTAMLSVYVLMKYRDSGSKKRCKSLSVIRANATYSKMSFLKDEKVEFFNDDLVYEGHGNESLYKAPFVIRAKGVFYAMAYSMRDCFRLHRVAKKMFGIEFAGYVLTYYKKRIPHKALFEHYMKELIFRLKPEVIYTGNKEDRFAIVEKRICQSSAIACTCIPHGLEYAFKMPAGLVGDTFYCTSRAAFEYLSRIYGNSGQKFCFDKKLAIKMFGKKRKDGSKKRIVFFPESREKEKNLRIIKLLDSFNVEYRVKLHVKDSLNNYDQYVSESMLVSDFDEAISNNICIARKSTVLLEAIYNESISIAVLIDEKDKRYVEYMFPSLTDEEIRKVYTPEELRCELANLGLSCV